MNNCLYQEKFPVLVGEISREEISKDFGEINQFFRNKIESHPFAQYIETFDHYSHTTNIEGGEIKEGVTKAINIIFCFGKKLLDPYVLSVRPRSIGICETESGFVISILEAPNPALTETMIEWFHELKEDK